MSDEQQMKHLEFIQNVITRMNSNSFMIKGWAITLVAALFALAAKDANIKFYFIAFIPIISFWILDGFFIATERRFRDLHKDASKTSSIVDFNMDPYSNINLLEIDENDKWYLKLKKNTCNKIKVNFLIVIGWILGIFSMTLIPFYGVLLLLMYFIKEWFHG